MTSYMRSQLLTVIENHIRVTGISASSLGKAALSDPNFVKELRKGKQPRMETANRVLDYVNAHVAELLAQQEAREIEQANDDLMFDVANILADYDTIVARAKEFGVNLVKRTVLPIGKPIRKCSPAEYDALALQARQMCLPTSEVSDGVGRILTVHLGTNPTLAQAVERLH